MRRRRLARLPRGGLGSGRAHSTLICRLILSPKAGLRQRRDSRGPGSLMPTSQSAIRESQQRTGAIKMADRPPAPFTISHLAMRALCEDINIRDTVRLRHILQAVESQPQIVQFIQKLSVNLAICWGGISEEGRREVCAQLYQLLSKTKNLRLLSLDLQECPSSCCFRNSGSENFAVNGANGKTDAHELHSIVNW